MSLISIAKLIPLETVHILYLHQYFVPPDGSGGTRSYEMARRLVQSGHQVTLVTSSAFWPSHYNLKQRGLTSLTLDGINLKIVRVPYSNNFSNIKRIFAFLHFMFKALIPLFMATDVDVVFATSTPLTIAVPGILAKWRHRCPMVFEVRDLWPEIPIALGALCHPILIWMTQKMEQYAYRKSDHIIALSPGMKTGVAKQNYSEQKISVIPNSCDIALFQSGKGTLFTTKYPFLKPSLVVYTGTLGLVNEVDYLVEIAHAMLKYDKDVHFLIVGSGKQRELIRDKAQLLGTLGKNLWMIKPVEKHEIPHVLAASSVATSFFLDIPELWNNSANKFFDALAAGKPIMINHKGWQADLLKKHKLGLVVPSDNPQKAAQQLSDFLKDSKQLKATEKRVLKVAKELFDRDKLAEDLGKILTQTDFSWKRRNNFKKKQLFDFCVTFVILFLCFPFICITALCVHFKQGSPILFKQQRPGLDEIPFEVYKFRTMTNAINTKGELLSDEERLSSIGQWLRKFSLDELPQLFNVLKGEMSLVGPRPLLMEYLPLYSEEQARRHDVLPGITGWAQVNGRNAISWEEKFELDLWYVDNQSFFLDLKILLLTVKKVFLREGVAAEGHVTVEQFKG